MAGAKAAWLARALRAGCPVLPGVVVPAAASQEAMRLGTRVLAERGSGGARREVARMPLDEELVAGLERAGGRLGDTLVVRSSSPLEASGRWAGAFTSYLEVSPGELAVAVRGCWASAFSPGTLDRLAAEGLKAAEIHLAVLVQRRLELEAGGTATLGEDGTVQVMATGGSPAGLLQGVEAGSPLTVSPHGDVRGAGVGLVGEGAARRLAEALRRCGAETGGTAVEWGLAEGGIWLLQVGRPERPAVPRPAPVPEAWRTPEAGRLARLARRYPGPVGEAMVLPWLAAPGLEELVPARQERAGAWAEARQLARRLAGSAWEADPEEALRRAAAAFRAVRGSDPAGGLARLAGLRPAAGGEAARLLGLIEAAARGLVEQGVLPDPAVLWYLEPGEVDGIVTEGRSEIRSRIGRTRWEPFVAGVVLGEGSRADGVAAGPGLGAGRLRVVEPGRPGRMLPREVVVAVEPRPHLAQLLWEAAGLVTLTGGPAAHLFESARSLGIPAVAACRLEEVAGRPLAELDGRYVVAVDGTAGRVALAPW